jgi:hypothetical protein
MKKMVLVLTLAVFALSGSSFAQDPNYFNNIGIYLDEGAESFCAETIAPGPVPAYLVLTRLSADLITGFECKIENVGGFLVNFAPRGQHIDAGSKPGEHIVGINDPGLPVVDGTCVVADMEILILDENPVFVFIGGVYFSSLANGAPAMIADGVIIEAHPSLGTAKDPVLILNSPCEAVAVEDASWGSVKSLYR